MNINVTNLSYSYNNETFAIKDVNCTICSGDFISVVGHTGSGKSTFIQNLNALLIPTKGKVTIDEFTIENKFKIKNIKELRKKVGIVFQFPEYQLFEETVYKDISFGPKNFNEDLTNIDKTIDDVLELVELDKSYKEKSPFELSGGEKRKVAIAGILAFDPDVLIVDEPTAGLDPQASFNMLNLFKKLNEKGKTIILVTHQMEYALEYSSKMFVFSNGNLIKCDTPINIFNDEKLTNELGLELPHIIELKNKLSKKYPNIKDKMIKNIDDLISFLKEN